MSVDETAKWSISERLKLAETMGRIEERLKSQDDALSDLLSYARTSEQKVDAMAVVTAENKQRLRAHEKIFAACVGTTSFFVGLWKALT